MYNVFYYEKENFSAYYGFGNGYSCWVNYDLIGSDMDSLKFNLGDICNVSNAQAEWTWIGAEQIIGQYEPVQDQYGHWHTVWVEYCIGSGYIYC